MKKIVSILSLSLVILVTTNANAQSDFTLNSRAWSTNYFASMLYGAAIEGIKELAYNSTSDSLVLERILPDPDIVFPIGLTKRLDSPSNIYGPYRRAFKSPFKHLGDWGLGVDASYMSLVSMQVLM